MKKTFFLFLIISVLYSVENTQNGILFSYKNQNAQSVFLVGSMNNWNVTATPMRVDESGAWNITLKLEPGKYLYKFMVDGGWKSDEENPNVEEDGYGGFNSVIEISSNGMLIQQSIEESKGIRSNFNEKIYFKGRYFSENIFLQDQSNRFMLNRPIHDLNLGINVKFNADFEGYTILNVNNSQEGTDMWKTHFNYKRTYLRLNVDYINVTGFDNFGIITFDNPLRIVGDIGYRGYDFGYDYSGVYIETSDMLSNKIASFSPLSFGGQLVFADKNGYGDDGGYKEDDISSARIKFSFPMPNNHEFTLGLSNYQYRTKISDNFVQIHDNHEVDMKYTKDFYQSKWKNAIRIELSSEYSKYENLNDSDSLKTAWMKGESIFHGVSVQFPAALNIYINHIRSSFELVETEIDFSRDRITLGFDYRINNFNWSLNGQFWKNNFHDDFSWSNYYEHAEKTDGNGRWFQEYSEVPFEKYTILGYETGFLWKSDLNYTFKLKNKKVETTLKNKFAHHDLSTGPKFIENIAILRYYISNKWRFKVDTRIPYYNDSFLGLKTDFSDNEDVFVSSYSEIAYYLSKNIWLSLGYGINPFSIDPVTDKFHNQGREEYLNSVGGLPGYIERYYGGLGQEIRNAETSLMNEKSISLQAVMEF